MAKFKLKDGSIIEAVKDCECLFHEGPHWLHMDEIWREKNRNILANGGLSAVLAYPREEFRRLESKNREMDALGIVETIA